MSWQGPLLEWAWRERRPDSPGFWLPKATLETQVPSLQRCPEEVGRPQVIKRTILLISSFVSGAGQLRSGQSIEEAAFESGAFSCATSPSRFPYSYEFHDQTSSDFDNFVSSGTEQGCEAPKLAQGHHCPQVTKCKSKRLRSPFGMLNGIWEFLFWGLLPLLFRSQTTVTSQYLKKREGKGAHPNPGEFFCTSHRPTVSH